MTKFARPRAEGASSVSTDTSEEASGIWESESPVSVSLGRPPGSTLSSLVVRAPRRWDIAAVLYRTLFDARVQIVHGSMRRTKDGRHVEHRLDLVEFDGAGMDRVRREEIELRVYDLLEESYGGGSDEAQQPA